MTSVPRPCPAQPGRPLRAPGREGPGVTHSTPQTPGVPFGRAPLAVPRAAGSRPALRDGGHARAELPSAPRGSRPGRGPSAAAAAGPSAGGRGRPASRQSGAGRSLRRGAAGEEEGGKELPRPLRRAVREASPRLSPTCGGAGSCRRPARALPLCQRCPSLR